jgi:uncharacterized membrane protein (UPF0136 family)
MLFFWRLLRRLLEQRWTASVAGILSALLLAGGIIGWVRHWHSFVTLIASGVIWGVVAFGAWTINR